MQTRYDAVIRVTADAHGIDPVLLQAMVCQESKGNAAAHRIEESYVSNPIVRRDARAWSRKWHGTPTAFTEMYDRAGSWGLTQILGQTAREAGLAEQYLPVLCDVDLNLTWACRLLTRWAKRATSPRHLIAMWNGGPGVTWPLPDGSPVRAYVTKVEAYMAETPYGEKPVASG